MTLYYYKKAPVEEKKLGHKGQSIGTIFDRISRKITSKFSSTSPLSIIIPIVFITCGLGILYGQIKPYAIHFLQSKLSNKLDQEIIPLVPDSYEEIRAAYISDPGSQYFTELLAFEEDLEQASDFEGEFYLTIEKIQIYDATVTANVDSTREETYQDALSHGLAHFKGTQIPGNEGNVLIYGHSAAGDYAEKHPKDVVTAFTRLFKLNIGDNITIKINGREINYTVKRIKEMTPDDIEIFRQKGGNTLTLMTCSPPGLNAKRLIVEAVQK
jgi:LPXTG-site transpeptidase (sortase) family protein